MTGNDDSKTAPSKPSPDAADHPGYADNNPRDQEDADISRPKPRDEGAETGGPARGGEDSPGAADD